MTEAAVQPPLEMYLTSSSVQLLHVLENFFETPLKGFDHTRAWVFHELIMSKSQSNRAE